MAQRRKRPIKRGPSRLTHYQDPEVERLRREVDEEIRRLFHLNAEDADDYGECCDEAFLTTGERAMSDDIDMGGNTLVNFDAPALRASLGLGTAALEDSSDFALAGPFTASGLTLAANTLLGRVTGGTGAAEELAVGGGLEFSGAAIRRSALTGDITASAGSAATTIANSAVTNAKLRNSVARSVIGRSANSTGAVADIAGAGADTILRDSGTGLAFELIYDVMEGHGRQVIAVNTTPVSVTNSTTVTDLIGFTIPARTLYAGRVLHGRLGGTYLQNSVNPRQPVFSIAMTGGTLWTATAPALAASAVVSAWSLEFEIAVESDTLVHLRGRLMLSSATAATTGVGALDAVRIDAVIGSVAAGVAVSSLVSTSVLTVNFNHPVNNATQTLVRTHYVLEVS